MPSEVEMGLSTHPHTGNIYHFTILSQFLIVSEKINMEVFLLKLG